MDAQTRRLKESELDTWQRNLTTLQAQAALHGMAPPLDLVNEIEEARRNVKRVMTELDAGEAQSIDATLTGLLELLLSIKRQQDAQDARLSWIEQQMKAWQRQMAPTILALLARWLSYLIVAALYTAFVVKESRDVMLINIFQTTLLLAPTMLLALLLRVLSNLLQPAIEVRRNDV